MNIVGFIAIQISYTNQQFKRKEKKKSKEKKQYNY